MHMSDVHAYVHAVITIHVWSVKVFVFFLIQSYLDVLFCLFVYMPHTFLFESSIVVFFMF